MSILLEAIGIVLETYFGIGFVYGFLIGDNLNISFSCLKEERGKATVTTPMEHSHAMACHFFLCTAPGARICMAC